MKSKTLGIVLAVVVILIGGALVLANNMRTKNQSSTPTPMADSMAHESSSPAASTEVESNSVTIQNFAFSPAKLTVKKGATITWTNKDSAHHTVTSDDGSPAGGPASQLLAQTQTYSLTFNTVGTFNYHCQPHPYMKGIIEVTE